MEEEEPGWGHWAMPPDNLLIDHEIHAGEFLELNDLLQPIIEEQIQAPMNLDEESGLTLSLTLPALSAGTAE